MALTATVIAPGRGVCAERPAAASPPAAATSPPAAPASGPREPTPDELDAAKRHFDSGRLFYDKGNYAAARAEFDAAYQLSHYPVLLYNLANTAEKQGEIPAAVRYYEEYLKTNPDDADAVRTKLEAIRPAGATAPPAAETTAAPVGKIPPVPALALLGAGAGLLIVGIGLGAGALSAASSVGDTANSGMPFAGTWADTERRGQQLSSAAIALDVVGGLALGAGAAWTGYWLYQRKKAAATVPPSSAATTPQTAVMPLGLGIGVVHHF